MAHTPKQAAPLTVEILKLIFSNLNLAVPADLTFWALLLMAFFGMVRKSNLVPNTRNPPTHGAHLVRGRVLVGRNNLVMAWRFSKTSKGERVHRILLPALPDSSLCPVEVYKLMVHAMPAPADSPAFLVPRGGHLSPFTYRDYNDRLREILNACGIEGAKFSTHSARVGGATAAHEAGVPIRNIQAQGDWSEHATTVQHYIKISLASRAKTTLHMARVENTNASTPKRHAIPRPDW